MSACRRGSGVELRTSVCALALAGCATSSPLPPSAAEQAFATRPAPVPAAPARPESAGRSRAATLDEMLSVRHLMREASRLRGLDFKAAVEVRVQDRAAMRAFVHEATEPERLARAVHRYVALGVLAPELDVRGLLESLMEDELIGYYDPERDLLALRDDVVASGALRALAPHSLEARATVVHELVHALQDQHFDLSTGLLVERTTDGENAFGALIEGDATLCMVVYAAEHSGQDFASVIGDLSKLRATVHQEVAADSLLGQAPPIVRDPLLFRYREGALFAAALVAHGGQQALDTAHRAPPRTTEEVILHQYGAAAPERRVARERLVRVLGDSPLVKEDEDSLGRLELGVVLGGTEGQAAAAAWRSDHYAIFGQRGVPAAAWVVEAHDGRGAQRIAELLAARCTPAETTGCAALRSGEFVLFLRGLSSEEELPLRRRFLPK